MGKDFDQTDDNDDNPDAAANGKHALQFSPPGRFEFHIGSSQVQWQLSSDSVAQRALASKASSILGRRYLPIESAARVMAGAMGGWTR
jgi:hypothetical protein